MPIISATWETQSGGVQVQHQSKKRLQKEGGREGRKDGRKKERKRRRKEGRKGERERRKDGRRDGGREGGRKERKISLRTESLFLIKSLIVFIMHKRSSGYRLPGIRFKTHKFHLVGNCKYTVIYCYYLQRGFYLNIEGWK
jgi:hypothetical protein